VQAGIGHGRALQGAASSCELSARRIAAYSSTLALDTRIGASTAGQAHPSCHPNPGDGVKLIDITSRLHEVAPQLTNIWHPKSPADSRAAITQTSMRLA
jgi:hypothetical protein